MNDKDFCIEYINKLIEWEIKPTALTKSQMLKIILDKQAIPIHTMFSDNALKGIFISDDVNVRVYKYIRDHQQEFGAC